MPSRTVISRTLAGAVAVGLLAAGCGSGTPGESAADAATNASGARYVDFWQRKFTDQEDAWYKKTVEAYNASQDEVEIRLTLVPGDAWDQKMKAAQAAGKAPDAYPLDYNKIQTAASLSQLAPLDGLLPPGAFDDVSETTADSVAWRDQHYAYPMLVEPSAVLWYRTDLFEAAGLDPDEPPATWDELHDYGSRLATGDVAGFSTAQVAVELGWTTWGLQWNAAGHLPISDDWSTAAADDPAYHQLLDAYQRLHADGVMPKQPLAPYADAAPMGQGKTAMMANGSWAASTFLKDYPDMVDKIAAAPMPSFDGSTDEPTATLGGWTWVVDAKSDSAQEAADFIAWALAGDPEQLLGYFEATDYSKLSPRSSVSEAIDAVPGVDELNPWRKTIAERIVPFAKPEPTYDYAVSEAFGTAIEEALQGGDIDEALAKANDSITKSITDLDLAGKGPGAAS